MMEDGSTEHQIAFYLWAICSPILITFGTVGNFLSIAVLSRRSMRSSSASVYLIALALADTTVLYTGLLRQFVREVAKIDIRYISNLSCKIHMWMVYVSLDTSVWILVAFTFERILSVYTPHKVKSYCTRKSSTVAIIGILLIMMALNSNILYGFEDMLIQTDNTTELCKCCSVSKEYDSFSENIWPWIDFSVYSLIPFIILIIGNSCISMRVLKSRRKTRRVAAQLDIQDSTRVGVSTITGNKKRVVIQLPKTDKNSSMTVILLVLNLVFLTTTAPVSVYLIVFPSWNKRAITLKDSALIDLTYAIVNLIMYINNSINFILYCASGSRFRREVIRILRKQRVWMVTETVKTDLVDGSKSHSVMTKASPNTNKSEIPDTAISLSQVPS